VEGTHCRKRQCHQRRVVYLCNLFLCPIIPRRHRTNGVTQYRRVARVLASIGHWRFDSGRNGTQGPPRRLDPVWNQQPQRKSETHLFSVVRPQLVAADDVNRGNGGGGCRRRRYVVVLNKVQSGAILAGRSLAWGTCILLNHPAYSFFFFPIQQPTRIRRCPQSSSPRNSLDFQLYTCTALLTRLTLDQSVRLLAQHPTAKCSILFYSTLLGLYSWLAPFSDGEYYSIL
jgi:hypothetical protein